MSSRKDDLICKRCDTYIGNSEDLDCCPICGKTISASNEDNE